MASFSIPNDAPYELIAAPFWVWHAPARTTPPLIDDDPDSPWTLLGSSGPMNYGDDGVTVGHPQTIEKWRALGSPSVRKLFRTEDDLIVSLMVADMTLEQYSVAMNQAVVTDTAAVAATSAGFRQILLARGFGVNLRALLVRGPSPYIQGQFLQYYIPIVGQTGSPELKFQRAGTPAMLAMEFSAILDVDATAGEELGTLTACDEAAS